MHNQSPEPGPQGPLAKAKKLESVNSDFGRLYQIDFTQALPLYNMKAGLSSFGF
jgi:hypothetical protein